MYVLMFLFLVLVKIHQNNKFQKKEIRKVGLGLVGIGNMFSRYTEVIVKCLVGQDTTCIVYITTFDIRILDLKNDQLKIGRYKLPADNIVVTLLLD